MRNLFFAVCCLFTTSVYAGSNLSDGKFGPDSIECIKNRSVYREFVKQKNYDDAEKPWRWAYANCPASSKNIFIDGAKILKHKIKQAKGNVELTNSLVDSLMAMYDLRIELFGQQEYVQGLKGGDMMKYQKDKLEEAFSYLQYSVSSLQNKSKATALYAYFQASTRKYKANSFEKTDVLEVYSEVSDYLDYNIENNSKYSKTYAKARTKVEKLFVPFATCEDLIVMFDAKYKESPDDLVLLKRICKVLDNKNCKDAKVYFDASAKLHAIEPSANSAYNMGNLSLQKNKSNEAIGYYNQALEMSNSENDKGLYYYGLSGAYFKSGKYQKARSMAYKSIDLLPNWGKPFILIGDIYAASANKCGENAFEIGMVYSASIDKFKKAKSVDASMTDLADKKIASYSKYLPSNEDAFFSGSKDGESYTIGCWINETTRVRIK